MFRMKCFLPGVGGVVCGISPEVCAHIHTSCEHVNTGLAIKKIFTFFHNEWCSKKMARSLAALPVFEYFILISGKWLLTKVRAVSLQLRTVTKTNSFIVCSD